MKASRKEPDRPFLPVTLELVTQDEVNAIHAVLNHTPLRQALGLPDIAFELLLPYRTRAFEGPYAKIQSMFKLGR